MIETAATQDYVLQGVAVFTLLLALRIPNKTRMFKIWWNNGINIDTSPEGELLYISKRTEKEITLKDKQVGRTHLHTFVDSFIIATAVYGLLAMSLV